MSSGMGMGTFRHLHSRTMVMLLALSKASRHGVRRVLCASLKDVSPVCNDQHTLASQIGSRCGRTEGRRACMCPSVCPSVSPSVRPPIHLSPPLPSHIDCNLLLGGSGEDSEQLVEDGWQECDHHVAFHGMQTLHTGNVERGVTLPMKIYSISVIPFETGPAVRPRLNWNSWLSVTLTSQPPRCLAPRPLCYQGNAYVISGKDRRPPE